MFDDFNLSDSQSLNLLKKKSCRNRLAAKYSKELDLEKIKDSLIDEIIYEKKNSRYDFNF